MPRTAEALVPALALFRTVLVVLVVLFTPAKAVGQPTERKIWFLSNGFHSTLGFRSEDLTPFLRRTSPDPAANWVMFGWGDRDYFMAKKRTPWIATKAALLPTPSAMQVISVPQVPQRVYRNSEVIELSLNTWQMREILRYLEEQFAGAGRKKPTYLGPGSTPNSAFYLGQEKFYFPKMCNWWIARGLDRAGLPIHRWGAITAPGLMRQVRKQGERVGGLCLPVDSF